MPSAALVPDRPFRLGAIAAGGLVLLVLLALTMPVDHDEGQYLAASYFTARGLLPYCDYAFLQTPLQPLLLAPLAWLFPGWLLVASRLANAALVALAAWLTGRTAARLGGNRWAGPAAIVAMLCFDSVLFGASVARNDALPLALFAFGIERMFAATGPIGRRRAALAGLALALAASAKISFALPAAAVAAQALWMIRRETRGQVLALLGGMALGALPTLVFLLLAPHQFLFGVLDYSIDAVRAWQALKGSTVQLGWPSRIVRVGGFLALGPGLALLAAAAFVASRRKQAPAAARPLGVSLGGVLIAALVAAILPMPPYRQYLIPLAVPLILFLAAHGKALRASIPDTRAWRIGAIALALGCLLLGTGRSLIELVGAPRDQRPLEVTAEAHAIGRVVRGAGGTGVAGLDPIRLVDSGLAFDPRFATGPFLFRAGNLPACRDPALCPVTYASLDRLDSRRPDAIVTGSEGKIIRGLGSSLDAALEGWAAKAGYRPVGLASQTIWLHPAAH